MLKKFPMETLRVPVDGRTARCRVVHPSPRPDRPLLGLPLLLLHGLGCSSEAWEPSLRRLAETGVDAPVAAPDLPGYGHSPGPGEALGIEDLADWAARLLDALGIERAHAAGSSMGCQVALALARRHPGRVGGVVLVAPTTGRRVVPAWRYLIGLPLDGLAETLRYNVTLLRMYRQMGVPRYLATIPKMLQDDPIGEAARVAAPCLLLRGTRDRLVPDVAAHRLAAALPRAKFVHVPDAAHAIQFNNPGEFVRRARHFLAGASN